jgi:hypothetical protein
MGLVLIGNAAFDNRTPKRVYIKKKGKKHPTIGRRLSNRNIAFLKRLGFSVNRNIDYGH